MALDGVVKIANCAYQQLNSGRRLGGVKVVGLPGGEVVDVGDDHLDLAAALLAEAGPHLSLHGRRHLV